MSRSADYDQRNAAFREAFRKPFEFAGAAPPTAEQVPAEAHKLGIEHHVEDVPNAPAGARLHWLGKHREAPNVILYFHGGGFCLPILEGHVRLLKQSIDRAGKDVVSVAILQYGLSPTSRYPVQITQGVEALRYLLAKGYKPSNIVIGGDSAGGNLALAVISVMLHGFNDIPPLRLEAKLAGLLLISPWTSFNADAPSWTENATKDIIPKECLLQLGPAYIDPAHLNNYSEPALAGTDWWRGVPAKKILNVYGAHEVFRDNMVQLGRELQEAGNDDVQSVECALQVHIDCVLDAQTGMKEGQMSHVVWEWLGSVF